MGEAVSDNSEDSKSHRVALLVAGITAAATIVAAVITVAWPDTPAVSDSAAVDVEPRQQPTPDQSMTPTPTPTPTEQEPVITVRRQGQLSLLGDPADLDAEQDDPQWGRLNESNRKFADVTRSNWEQGGWAVDPIGEAQVAALKGEPSYDVCASAQGYSTSFSYFEGFAGRSWCVITRDGRFAAMTLTDSDPDNPSFDVTVWEKV